MYISSLNKANSFDTDAPFLDLDLSIIHVSVSSKIYDQQKDFNFEIVIFHFVVVNLFLHYLPFLWCIHFTTSVFTLQEYVHLLVTSTIETNV